jgi:hypothetical protein
LYIKGRTSGTTKIRFLGDFKGIDKLEVKEIYKNYLYWLYKKGKLCHLKKSALIVKHAS